MLRKNISATFLASTWAGIMGIIFVPSYIAILGIESYALIGLFTTLMSIFAVLDLGFAVSVNREMSRLTGSTAPPRAFRDTVRTLELPYLAFAIAIGAIVATASEWIATNWLSSSELTPTRVQHAIAVMALAMTMQWPINFYSSALQGLQRHILLAVTTVVFSTLRSLGALLVIKYGYNSIEAFFYWQAGCNALNCVCLMMILWRALPSGPRPRLRIPLLKGLSGFAAGTLVVGLLTSGVTQADKAMLSKFAPLGALGDYCFAYIIAFGLYRLSTPVFAATYPRMTELVAKGDLSTLASTYHRGSQLISLLTAPLAIVIAVHAHEVIVLWTQDAALADRCHLLVRLLIAGTLLSGLLAMPYGLQLSHGWTKLRVCTYSAILTIQIPLTYYLTVRHGAVGTAAVWIVLNAILLSVEIPIMHRFVMQHEMWRWFRDALVFPCLGSLAVAAIFRLGLPRELGRLQLAVYLACCGVATLVGCGLATPVGRHLMASVATRMWIFKRLRADAPRP